MFGTLGDFSDSSPDNSPTISRYWTKMNDEAYCGYEKHFINVDQQKEILKNQYRMEQNLQNLEKSLEGDLKSPVYGRNALDTINEENTNISENTVE